MRIKNNTNSKVTIASLNISLDPFSSATVDTIHALGSVELQSYISSGTVGISDFATPGTPMDTLITSDDTLLSIDSAGATDIHGYLKNTTPGTPVAVKNDYGFSIGNSGTTTGNILKTMTLTTTNTNTLTNMNLDDSGSTVGLAIASGTVHGLTIYLTAKGIAGTHAGKGAFYRIDAAISNVSGTTAFVGSPSALVLGDNTVGAWSVSYAANNTDDRFDLRVAGDTGTTVKWVARVQQTIVS